MYIIFAGKNSKINIVTGQKKVKSPKNKPVVALYPCPPKKLVFMLYE
jgi:hypothetical protein